MERLIVFYSEDGGSREDCSVFYSEYLLVKAPPNLSFSEPMFKDVVYNKTKISDFVREAEAYGYTVVSPLAAIFYEVIPEDDEEDD